MQPANEILSYIAGLLQALEIDGIGATAPAQRQRSSALAARLSDAGYRMRRPRRRPRQPGTQIDYVLGIGAPTEPAARFAARAFERRHGRIGSVSELADWLEQRRPRSILVILTDDQFAAIEPLARADALVGFVIGSSPQHIVDRLIKLLLYRSTSCSSRQPDILISPEDEVAEIADSGPGLRALYGPVDPADMARALTQGARILGLFAHADGYTIGLHDVYLCARAGPAISAIPAACFGGPLCGRKDQNFDDELRAGRLVPAVDIRADLLLNFICYGFRPHGALGAAGTLGSRLLDNPDVGQVLTSVGAPLIPTMTMPRVVAALYAGVELGAVTKHLNRELAVHAGESSCFVLFGDPLWRLTPAETSRRSSAPDAPDWRMVPLKRPPPSGVLLATAVPADGRNGAQSGPRDQDGEDRGEPILPLGALFGTGSSGVLCTRVPPGIPIEPVPRRVIARQRARLETLDRRIGFLEDLLAGMASAAAHRGDEDVQKGIGTVGDAKRAIRGGFHLLDDFRGMLITRADLDAPVASAEEACREVAVAVLPALAAYLRRFGGLFSSLWMEAFESVPSQVENVGCPYCTQAASVQIRGSWHVPGAKRRLDQCISCGIYFDGPADAATAVKLSAATFHRGDNISAVLESPDEDLDGALALLETVPRRLGQAFATTDLAIAGARFELDVAPDCPQGYQAVTVMAMAAGSLSIHRLRVLVI